MPYSIPTLTSEELERFHSMDYSEIAFTILNKFIENDISQTELRNLCNESYNFDVPLEKVYDRKYIMRLDQGPTASFKDFAARMMSRLMQYFLSINNQHLTILTATSGDTGSAVASAFFGLSNINVIILYPAEEVTLMQRKQMTTLHKNIRVVAINGKFDDCQRLVKEAFVDPSLSHMNLSSANSINIGRLLPQSAYYFYAWSRLSGGITDRAIFSVPSGNFGNLMGGLIAKKMGMPVKKFIIATNENDEVPEFIRTGKYKSISPSINCISSAMNVGHPSNLPRIVELYGGIMDETGVIKKMPDHKKMQDDFYSVSVTDEETRMIIAGIYKQYGIILEPHGAIAWHGINDFCNSDKICDSEKQLFVSLETAHPAKFPKEILESIKIDPPLPSSLKGISDMEEEYVLLDNNYELFKVFIENNF